MATKTKWTKPLKVVTEYDLKSLRGLLAKHAPIGKERLDGFTVNGKQYTYRVKPPAPGRLRKAFFKEGAVKLSKSGKIISIEAPGVDYARSVDQGHKTYYVGPSKSRYGKWLRAGGHKKGHRPMLMFSFGGRFFFKHVKIPATTGQNFTGKAFDEWVTRRNINKNVKMKWAPYKGK